MRRRRKMKTEKKYKIKVKTNGGDYGYMVETDNLAKRMIAILQIHIDNGRLVTTIIAK